MNFVSSKVERASTIAAMLRHAADLTSRAALLSCYASTLRSITSKQEVSVRLKIAGSVFPFRMRKSDIFVLEEILVQGQYQLVSRLPERPTIVDAGANIGVTSLWLLAHHPGAALHAFEPEPENFRLLSMNLGSQPGVALSQAALTAKRSTIRLQVASHGAMHSVVDRSVGEGSVEVQCLTLADYLAATGVSRVDLLKIDVEGSELDLLKGLGGAIAAVQVIVGEFHEKLVNETEFYGFLNLHGFRVLRKHCSESMRADHVHLFEASRG